MSTTKIRHCPFCGCDSVQVQPWHGGAPTKHLVKCGNDDCDVAPSVTGETLEKALARWNKRAPRMES